MGNKKSNPTTSKFMRRLDNSDIVDLTWVNVNLDEQRILCQHMQKNKEVIGKLLLTGTHIRINEEIIEIWEGLPNLTHLDLSHNNFSATEFKILTEYLSKNNTLKNLDLSSINGMDIEMLCYSLYDQKSIMRLALGYNKLGIKDLNELCNLLLKNEVIIDLNLSENTFGDPICLYEMLKKNHTLTKLTMRVNLVDTDKLKEALELNDSLAEFIVTGFSTDFHRIFLENEKIRRKKGIVLMMRRRKDSIWNQLPRRVVLYILTFLKRFEISNLKNNQQNTTLLNRYGFGF